MKSIDEMTAQELRVEIAKERGYTAEPVVFSKNCTRIDDTNYYALKLDGVECDDSIWLSPNDCFSYDTPDVSSDIADAFELVEDMNIHGYTVNIQIDHNGTTVFVKERGIVTGEIRIDATFSKITPEAISRAWLKWKRGKNE